MLFFSTTIKSQINSWLTMYPDTEPFRFDHIVFGIHYDTWNELPSGISTDILSVGYSIHAYKDISLNKTGSIAMAIGFGFTARSVRNNGDLVVDTDGNTTIQELPDNYDYKINKLATRVVELPFELRFRNVRNKLRFYPGIKLGYIASSFTKRVDDDVKVKEYRVDNLNPWQYGLTSTLGYKQWGISFYYGLTNLFEDGKGPDFKEFQIGINFYLL